MFLHTENSFPPFPPTLSLYTIILVETILKVLILAGRSKKSEKKK